MNSLRLHMYRLLTLFMPETRGFGVKARLLRWCGAKVGTNVRICSSTRIVGDGQLIIGDDVWIGAGGFISPVGKSSVTICSCVDMAPGVMLLTGSHKIDPEGDHVAGEGCSASVVVGSGCWLGARSLILPGVTLAQKTVVAAGAVVAKSHTEPLSLLVGIPAVFRKRIGEGG